MPIFLYTVGVLALTAAASSFFPISTAPFANLAACTPAAFTSISRRSNPTSSRAFTWIADRAALAFSLLARLWLVLVAAITARGVLFFVPGTWEAAVEMVFFLGAEVVVAMQFFPALLLARAPGNWVLPFVPLVRVLLFIIWPVQAVLDLLDLGAALVRRKRSADSRRRAAAGHRSFRGRRHRRGHHRAGRSAPDRTRRRIRR